MSPAPVSPDPASPTDGSLLELVTSNRLDRLVDRLAEVFAADPLPPLEREVVVVQSQGMQRWLTLELARRQGIAASFTTPFPRPYCLHLARCLLDGEPPPPSEDIARAGPSLFGQERLGWRLFAALGELADPDGGQVDPAFAVPASYLRGDRDQRKRFQLSARLAALFESYQFFRPELLAAWAEGRDVARVEPGGRGAGEGGPIADDVRATAAWQARLWRRLLAEAASLAETGTQPEGDGGDGGPRPLAEPLDRRLGRLIETLRTAETAPEGLPRRLTVLGVSSLPPIFIDLLAALARFVPVAICFVSPTYHYWGDLRSEREQARILRRRDRRRDRRRQDRAVDTPASDAPASDAPASDAPASDADPAASADDSQHLEEGHPLLAALGRQGRDFFELLQAADPTGAAWQELDFVDPLENETSRGGPTALEILQSDILHLRRRGPQDGPNGHTDVPLPLDPKDRSVEIHACHSPMREMEVLRDRLLDAFEKDPELRPSGVLVLMPDIELYGPYIQAVFGVGTEGSPYLPFSIADRRAGRERPPSETFLQVLELVGSRLVLRQVFDLLDVPAVRRRFGLGPEALPALRRRLSEAGVRWAMDGEQKERDFDLPADEPNTWRHGLDRLLMGYATGETDALVAGVLPHSGHTAGGADELGRFATYVETLFHHLRALTEPRPLDAWASDLADAVEALFEAEDGAEERGLQWVRDAIHDLRRVASDIDFRAPVDVRVIQEYLRRGLEVEGFGSGFFGGTITFCALRPMRTIPFRLVCVCGLDDGAFPRQDRRRSFDLVGRFPRPGDRSLREDDRYLFLETLLAAEKRLLLSYVGRSQRDASHKEPSVVLSELMDQLDRTFTVVPDSEGPADSEGRERTARDLLRIEHRLQPWNPEYFDSAEKENDGGDDDARDAERPLPPSYSADDALGADALLSEPEPVPPFVGQPLEDPAALDDPAPGEQEPTLELDIADLVSFWLLPARWFCQRRLQIELERAVEEIPEHEPFHLEGLESYRWRQWLLERRLAGEESAEARELASMRAAGGLPGGPIGRHVYRRLARRVDAFVDRLPPFEAEPDRSIEIDGPSGESATGGRWQLVGALGAQTREGPLHFRCASLRPRDRLRAWIEHLAAAADARQRGTKPRESRLVGEDGAVRFAVPDDPLALLDTLVRGFRQGQRLPLPFFPETSHAYTKRFLDSLDPRSRARTSPLDAARQRFLPPDFAFGPRLPSESEDPWVRLAFRGLEPLEDPALEEWALELWRPALEHQQDEDGGRS